MGGPRSAICLAAALASAVQLVSGVSAAQARSAARESLSGDPARR